MYIVSWLERGGGERCGRRQGKDQETAK